MILPNPSSPLSSSTSHSKRASDSSVLMTITLEPIVRHSPADGKGTIVVSRSAPPPPHTTQSDKPLNPSSAKATNLLQNFIEAYKEVDSYRYVRRDWVMFLARAHHPPCAEMETRSSSMATIFPSLRSPLLPDTMHPSPSTIPLAFGTAFNRAETSSLLRWLLGKACTA